MNNDEGVKPFDSAMIMETWAKELFAATPDVFILAAQVVSKDAQFDDLVARAKEALVSGGDKPAHADLLLVGLRDMALRLGANPDLTKSRNHVASPSAPRSQVGSWQGAAAGLNGTSVHDVKRYG